MSKRKVDPWVDSVTSHLRDDFINNILKGRTPTVSDITCDIVKHWYTLINSHGCVEGHLPQFVPLDYIDKIVMPESSYKLIKKELRACRLGSGRLLDDMVVSLSATGQDFQCAAREWQRDFFQRRVSLPQYASGMQIEARAFSFGLEGMKGEEVFLPLRMTVPQRGFAVRFRAKGQHIRLSFLSEMQDSRQVPLHQCPNMYLAVIGAFKNSKTFLKRNNTSGGPVCVEASRTTNPTAMAWPDCYRDYWITFDAQVGSFRIGHGGRESLDDASKVLLQWQDPEPHQDLQYIAVSCWCTPLSFAMLKHMDPQEAMNTS